MTKKMGRAQKRKIRTLPSYSSPQELAKIERGWLYNGPYAYLNAIMNDDSPDVACMKGAQLGFSEAIIHKTLCKLLNNLPVLYTLPTASDCLDFSNAKVKKAIDDSKNLRRIFDIDNVFHKTILGTNTSLYFRGMRERSKLKTISVAYLAFDERDEMDDALVELARERLSGFSEKNEISFSTPTILDYGIDLEMKKRDKYFSFIPCLKCGELQRLTLEDNIDVQRELLKCYKCGKSWTHKEKCYANSLEKTMCTEKGNGKPGYHVSQLYSPTVTTKELCTKIKDAEGNETKKQELYNSKFGLPYEAKGSRLAQSAVDACLGTWPAQEFRLFGIDVAQTSMHYALTGFETEYGLVVDNILRVPWNNLPTYLKDIGCIGGVMDANPERAKAREFIENFRNGRLALYPEIEKAWVDNEEDQMIKIHRTEAIDRVLALFRQNRILICKNLPLFETFKKHVCSVVRVYKELRGKMVARYVSTGPDHFLQALVYLEMSCKVSNGMIKDSIVGSFV